MAVPESSNALHLSGDSELIQIANAAIGDAYQRAGDWMACRVGCTQCCVGVFAISQLDAERLRVALTAAEPAVQERIAHRVTATVDRLVRAFPGDTATGVLGDSDEEREAFEVYANDQVCPVLDPATGACDLYAARPMLCRSFGPPLSNDEDGLAVCELCFAGAPPEEVKRCEVDMSFQELEAQVEETFERETGRSGMTVIAFALREVAANIARNDAR